MRVFITKHLGYKIESDSKHIPIRTFGYEAMKIERNMIMGKKYFENLEYREVNGVFIPDIELSEEKQKVLQSIENYHSQLLESLTVEQKHLLEEYESCANEITSQTECEIFIDGFRLGFHFACEFIKE